MAVVWLDEAGWKDGDVPDICLECGAPAPDRVRKTFGYQPPWVYLTLVLGAIAFVLAIYFTRKEFRSRVPMCPEHKKHWRKRELWIFLSILMAGLLGGLAIMRLTMTDDATRVTLLLGIVRFSLVGGVIAVAYVYAGTIRVTTFSKRSIRLTKVSPEFVAAYEDGPDCDGNWRGRVKADLDPIARHRWNESHEDRHPAGGVESIRQSRPEDDDPRKSEDYRTG
jgi:hypothetical protein